MLYGQIHKLYTATIMKHLLNTLIIALTVTAISLALMLVIPIRDTSEAACCDDFDLQASYGLPLPFKQDYSGGLSGRGKVTIEPIGLMVDGVLVFVATAVVLSVISVVRKRRGSA